MGAGGGEVEGGWGTAVRGRFVGFAGAEEDQGVDPVADFGGEGEEGKWRGAGW